MPVTFQPTEPRRRWNKLSSSMGGASGCRETTRALAKLTRRAPAFRRSSGEEDGLRLQHRPHLRGQLVLIIRLRHQGHVFWNVISEYCGCVP
jgi:hypothetical protein